MTVEGIKINVISRKDLIENKRKSARGIDITDAEKIEKQMEYDEIRKNLKK